MLDDTDVKKYSKATRKTHRHKFVGEQAVFGKAVFPLGRKCRCVRKAVLEVTGCVGCGYRAELDRVGTLLP